MKKILFTLFALTVFCTGGNSVFAQVDNPKAVVDLLERIGGSGASALFETTVDESLATDGSDLFVISQKNGRPYVKGNNILAVTTGLNWYLNHYAHINLAWNNLATDLSVAELPLPATDEIHRCTADYRYYMNYCTFSYSTAFWTWERWQQEIDWMALHGINMPLQIVGLEVVWRNVLVELGFESDEIADFIAGPGFMAWFAMNNLEGWGGTVSAAGVTMDGNPEWWYKRQEQLCKQILAGMREFGMRPVLPGYCGMVPNSITGKSVASGWTIINGGSWAGGYNRPDILDPRDVDDYNKMSEIYYRHLKAVMGTSEFYSMDPFHESAVPSGYESAIYNGVMAAMDNYAMTAEELAALNIEKPKWIVQYWQGLPNYKGFSSVKVESPDRFIALDLFSDGNPNWSGSHYAGHDFIYCNLSNFGGRTGLHGRIAKTMAGYYDALATKPGQLKGVGATPEGIENNPVLYDMIFELPWISVEPTPEEWLAEYAYSRYGVKSDAAKEAWRKLLHSVYKCDVDGQQGTSEPVILARPAWTVNSVSSWSKSAIYWDLQDVLSAAGLLLSMTDIPETSKENYGYDVIDVVRQTMVDFAYDLLIEIRAAYNSGDTVEYKRLYGIFLQLMLDVDTMLANDTNFTLERWTGMARDITDEVDGTTENDKNWLEWNARTQVTVWSKSNSNLHDYSNRCWSGLIKDFHYERWKYFFEGNGAEPSGGWYSGFEYPWTVDFSKSYEGTTTNNDAVECARSTFAQYFGVLAATDGQKYYFPMGVSRDATKTSVQFVCDIYRGTTCALPVTIGNGATVSSVWVDLNADLAQTADELLVADGLNIEIPADAKIGKTKAVVKLSDATEITFYVAVREVVTEPRLVTVLSGANGAVSIEGTDATSVTTVEPVVMNAIANSGYNFYRWVDASGNTVGNENPYTYYAKEAAEFTAEFIVDKWGVPTENKSDWADIQSTEQFVSLITFARYNRESEVIYETATMPQSLFNTVSGIVNVARGSSFDLSWSDLDSDGLKYCYLSAYIDMNADGDFDDEGELLKVAGTLGAQNNAVCEGNINVLLPYDMPLGITHMRLRFDGAWKGGYDSETNAFPAKADINRMTYEIVLNVTEYPETSSLVDIYSNNEEWGAASMVLYGQIGENKGDDIPVASGMLMTLNAIPVEGAEFVGWQDRYGRIVSTMATYEMYAPEDATLTAIFRKSLALGEWEIEYRTVGNNIILTEVLAGEGALVIPQTVQIGNVTYTVVGFDDNLFRGNTALQSLTIPATIGYIGEQRDCLFSTSVIGEGVQDKEVANTGTLNSSSAWTLNVEATSDGSSFNQWGSALLATGSSSLGTTYNGGFQFYLKADGSLIVKLGSAEHLFSNTAGKSSSIKIAAAYNGNGSLFLSVTNSEGSTTTKMVSGYTMSDISVFSTALPAGVNVTNIEAWSGYYATFSGAIMGNAADVSGSESDWQTTVLPTTLSTALPWEISMSVTDGGANFNRWGSALIATGSNPFADTYADGFQLYLQENGNLVLKLAENSDTYRFTNLADSRSFDITLRNSADGVLSVTAVNDVEEAQTLTLLHTPADITTFTHAIPLGVDIERLEVRVGSVLSAFEGCSLLESISVEEGGYSYTSNEEGELYNADGSILIFSPEGKELGVARGALSVLVEKTDELIDSVATVTAGVEQNLPLQATNPDADYYVWTNAQEPSEGDISGLVDNNNSTHFHTIWSSGYHTSDDLNHHFTIDLDNAVSVFRFQYVTRGAGYSNYPSTIEIYGSTDGEKYTLIETVTDLPTGAATYNHEMAITDGNAYNNLRFMVTDATGTKTDDDGFEFFHMGEFDLYAIVSVADVFEKFENILSDDEVAAAYDCMSTAQNVCENATTTVELTNAYNSLLEKYEALCKKLENATGIENTVIDALRNNVIYDLSGRLIDKVAVPGIYIVGGKKIFIK